MEAKAADRNDSSSASKVKVAELEQTIKSLHQKIASLEKNNTKAFSVKVGKIKAEFAKTLSAAVKTGKVEGDKAKSLAAKVSKLEARNQELESALERTRDQHSDVQMLVTGLKFKRQQVQKAVGQVVNNSHRASEASTALKEATSKQLQGFGKFMRQSLSGLVDRISGENSIQAVRVCVFLCPSSLRSFFCLLHHDTTRTRRDKPKHAYVVYLQHTMHRTPTH